MGTTVFATHKDNAISTVASGSTAIGSSSGTGINVVASQGARFALGPATVCPASTVPDPTNAEVVYITAIASDALTVTRAQEGTTALTNIAVGYVIYQGPTQKTFTDIENAVGAIETPTINTQSGTTYTLVLSDAGKVIEIGNAAANTVTIPANSSVAFPIGTQIIVRQTLAGLTTVAITTDTLNYFSPTAAGTAQTAGQWASVLLTKRTATAWTADGCK
jgi:hypothetical protein